jgi:hypothetical protein
MNRKHPFMLTLQVTLTLSYAFVVNEKVESVYDVDPFFPDSGEKAKYRGMAFEC